MCENCYNNYKFGTEAKRVEKDYKGEISMGALKDVVLLIIISSGIVGICCTASGVKMYLGIKKNSYSIDEISDGINGLAHINMSLGVLLLIVSVVIGMWVYGVRF